VKTPSIVKLVLDGATLTPLQAAAGKLWLVSNDGAEHVRRAVEAYWTAHGGDDAYWELMSSRMACDACGETYTLENLSICPNCFKTYCYKHARTCNCGCATVG
jgi:hypothetical protein